MQYNNITTLLGESIDSIESKHKYVINNFVFDIRELKRVIEENPINPYTQEKLCDEDIEKINSFECDEYEKEEHLDEISRTSSLIAYLHNKFVEYGIGFEVSIFDCMSSEQILKFLYIASQNNEISHYNSFYYEITCQAIVSQMKDTQLFSFLRLSSLEYIKSCLDKIEENAMMNCIKCSFFKELIVDIIENKI